MKFRLFPQERTSQLILTGLAEQNVAGIQLLSEMFGSPVSELERLAEQVRNTDGESSNQQYALLTHLRSSFINSLPRGDTFELARILREVMQGISAAAEVLSLLKLDRIPRRFTEVLEAVARQAELSVSAMRSIEDLDSLEDYWIETLRLSRRASSTLRRFRAEYLKEANTVSYLKFRELSSLLEQLVQNFSRLANKTAAIVVKES